MNAQRKIYLLLSLTILFTTSFINNTFAQSDPTQKAAISGMVVTADNLPAEGVAVQLMGTDKSTVTSESGFYIFKNLPAGTYSVEVSLVGHASKSLNVTLETNQHKKNIFFKLEFSQAQLEEVVVSTRSRRYRTNHLSTSLRLPSTIMETPQNIQVISKQLIADQQVFDMVDGVTRNVIGASRVSHLDNQYAQIRMRGSKIPAFRNGMNIEASWGPTAEDAAMIERIEFVKGPAGFMLANGEPGGFYNVVTKKPTGENRQSITMSMGSFSTYRTALDWDGKLSKDGRLLYRLNVAAQQKDFYTKYNYSNRVMVSPVIKYLIDDKTSVTMEYSFQGSKYLANGNYTFSKRKLLDDSIANNFFYGDPSVNPGQLRDHSAYIYFDHQLNNRWKAHAQVAYFNFSMLGNTIWPSTLEKNGNMTRALSIADEAGENRFAQLSLMGEEYTGKIRHRILAGADFGTKKFWGDFRNLTPSLNFGGGKMFNVYNPIYGLPFDSIPQIDRSVSLRTRAGASNYATVTSYGSVYLQDELGFMNDKLRVSVAGRFTYAETVGKTNTTDIKSNVFSPRFGVSYSINKTMSVYGLYDQSFIPQSGTDFFGKAFVPIRGNDIEGGIKNEWFGGRWQSSLSVYQIDRDNALTPDNDPTHVVGSATFQTQVGQTRTKGVEVDINGELLPGLNLTANYAYTDSKISKEDGEPAVSKVGDVTPNTAAHITNAWLQYRLPKGMFEGFGLSGGMQWLAERYVSTTKTSNIPNYFRLDGGASYQKGKYGISLVVNNLLDDRKQITAASLDTKPNANTSFYSYVVEPRRNFRMSVTYRF